MVARPAGTSTGPSVDAGRWLREAVVHRQYHDPFWTLKCSHALLA
jgi:hypothetical protein